MNKITKTYLEILLEAQFERDGFKRFDIYRDIEIYYNYEHVKQRLQERYPSKTFSVIRLLVKAFLKNIINENFLINKKTNNITFICYCSKSEIWIAGRFKKNFGKWRVEINTLLPPNPIYPINIKLFEVNI